MKTWQIIDEYHVHGLAFTVKHCAQFLVVMGIADGIDAQRLQLLA